MGAVFFAPSCPALLSCPHLFMSKYEELIADYRVSLPRRGRVSNLLVYGFGLFLFIAPFLKSLAFYMAIVSLSYFILVFVVLAIKDLYPFMIMRVGLHVAKAQNIYYSFLERFRLTYEIQEADWSLRKNLLAFRRAFPL